MNVDDLLAELDYTPLILVAEPPGGAIPYPPSDDQEMVRAKANAAKVAMDHGLAMTPASEEQKATARAAFAGDIPLTPAIHQTPEVVLHLNALLSEYDHKVVRDAQQLRNYVTNRLIVETTDKNPTIRLRALENLGKISDVGLFTDKSEVTIKNQPAAELEMRLRSRLEKLIGSGTTEKPAKQPEILENGES